MDMNLYQDEAPANKKANGEARSSAPEAGAGMVRMRRWSQRLLGAFKTRMGVASSQSDSQRKDGRASRSLAARRGPVPEDSQ